MPDNWKKLRDGVKANSVPNITKEPTLSLDSESESRRSSVSNPELGEESNSRRTSMEIFGQGRTSVPRRSSLGGQVKPKSILSSTTLMDNVPPSIQDSRKSLTFQASRVRSFDGSAPSASVKFSDKRAIYKPSNFVTDRKTGDVDDSSIRRKVKLTKLHISRYHINGEIHAKPMSIDQACFVRFTTDKWDTFQETQAVDIGPSGSVGNLNGNDRYTFDYIIPMPREFGGCTTLRPVTSRTDQKGNPLEIQFFIVLRSLGMLYTDDNEREHYVMSLAEDTASESLSSTHSILSSNLSGLGEGHRSQSQF